jgi:hypothetical protein
MNVTLPEIRQATVEVVAENPEGTGPELLDLVLTKIDLPDRALSPRARGYFRKLEKAVETDTPWLNIVYMINEGWL